MYTLSSRESPLAPFLPGCPWEITTAKKQKKNNKKNTDNDGHSKEIKLCILQVSIHTGLELHLQEDQVSRCSRFAPVALRLPVSRYSHQHLASPWTQLVPGDPAEPIMTVKTHYSQTQHNVAVTFYRIDPEWWRDLQECHHFQKIQVRPSFPVEPQESSIKQEDTQDCSHFLH